MCCHLRISRQYQRFKNNSTDTACSGDRSLLPNSKGLWALPLEIQLV